MIEESHPNINPSMNKDVNTTTKKRSLFTVYSHLSQEELSLLSTSDEHIFPLYQYPIRPITPPVSLQPDPFAFVHSKPLGHVLIPPLRAELLSPSKRARSEQYEQNNKPTPKDILLHPPIHQSRMEIIEEDLPHPAQHSTFNHPSMQQSLVEEDGDISSIRDFKLPASKSPIMEAMVVCGLNGWGIEITKNEPEIIFKVTDFNRYYRISRVICSKQRPTDDLGSRIKALKRWFVDFPKKKYCCNNSFCLTVKPKIVKKVLEMIDRNEVYKNFDKL